jgi:hypothetical protein
VATIIITEKEIFMNKIKLLTYVLIALAFASCKKDEFGLLSQNHPDVPVTVSNLYAMTNGVPTVATSLSGGGAITITLTIPSGRTIKEITKVALGTNTTNYIVVQNSTAAYNSAPIPGNGTSVTFTTSLTEFTAKTGIAVTTGGTNNSFLSRYFYFLITLDNGEQVIPVPVRVYVNS